MRRDAAWIATTRFGLGARPGEIEAVAADPRGWLNAQLDGPIEGPSNMPSSPEIVRAAMDVRGDPTAQRALRRRHRELFRREARARLEHAGETDRPFVERWVAFWSDHFTVSALKGPVLGAAGAFEREAIRPHALGSFGELLGAATRHPAMLVYLDNAQSIGPRSRAGRRRDRGLNENLAREILELHTLGVDGGYDQADVEAFAAILTGWTVDRRAGGFRFVDRRHEPGSKDLLGRRFVEAGEGEGEAALAMLAAHPSTARNVARELCRHFVSDRPPAGAVAELERVFRTTDGDLRRLAEALVGLDAAWGRGEKVKAPFDLVVSAARATGGGRDRGRGMLRGLTHLGQIPWTAPSPAGWPDEAAGWVGPEALLRRIEFAEGFARRYGRGLDGSEVARAVLGDRMKPATRRAIEGADDGLAVLLASAEFQRR